LLLFHDLVQCTAMAKDRDKDLSRGPDPLKAYHNPGIGDRVKDVTRTLVKRLRRNPLTKTPPEKLRLTQRRASKFELGMAERATWVSDDKDCRDKRELAERVAQARIETFERHKWLTASREARVVALQALENRLQKMQGRPESYKVEVASDGERRASTNHETRTVTLHSKLVERANPRDAVAALYVQMHLLMQREAVKNPAAFAEHGIKKIQEWAEPKEGGHSFSKADALSYAKRQTDHLR
jgi:hypothetical protein